MGSLDSDSPFINIYFSNIWYKQISGVAMGSPSGLLLANALLDHHEQNWLDGCFLE